MDERHALEAAWAAALKPAPLPWCLDRCKQYCGLWPKLSTIERTHYSRTFCISCEALKARKEDARGEKARRPNLSISAELHHQDGTSLAHQLWEAIVTAIARKPREMTMAIRLNCSEQLKMAEDLQAYHAEPRGLIMWRAE
ncbi:hypothetical protein NKH84_28990 [Mesorhizobium sp. M0902]